MVRSAAVGLVALLLGCGATTRTTVEDRLVVPLPPPDESLLELVGAALRADARMEPATPLYVPDARIVANGELRPLPPRYAGLTPGGEVGITTSRLEVRETVAWAFVEYRWFSVAEGSAREGVATFILVPAPQEGGGWRILHAHSSSPPPA